MSVIIASWNAGDVLGACLASLETQTLDGGFETIVVNDASTDATAELLRDWPGPGRVVVTNERNLGFSGANNRGAEEARGRVLFFLNSDTELHEPGVLERLAEAAEDETIGIVGPKLLNPDGSMQPSCAAHPSVATALVIGSGMQRLLPDRVLRRRAPQFWSHERSIDTDWLLGAALAIRAEVFRALGGFWTTTYAEEADLAYRVQQRGLRVRYDTGARLKHLGNHSLGKKWSVPGRARVIAQAEVAFLETHYGRARRTAIRAITATGLGARALAHAALRRRERAAVYRSMAAVYLGASAAP
jgi:GT2 family glycosyltransferase